LLKAIKVIGQTFIKELIELLNEYGFKNNFFPYIKYEGSNLNDMIIVLKLIMNYKCLGLEERFQGFCVGSAFFKTC
jgi:hypothetical protein